MDLKEGNEEKTGDGYLGMNGKDVEINDESDEI